MLENTGEIFVLWLHFTALHFRYETATFACATWSRCSACPRCQRADARRWNGGRAGPGDVTWSGGRRGRFCSRTGCCSRTRFWGWTGCCSRTGFRSSWPSWRCPRRFLFCCRTARRRKDCRFTGTRILHHLAIRALQPLSSSSFLYLVLFWVPLLQQPILLWFQLWIWIRIAFLVLSLLWVWWWLLSFRLHVCSAAAGCEP